MSTRNGSGVIASDNPPGVRRSAVRADLTAAAKPRAGDVRQVPLPGGDPTLVAATS